MEKLTYKLDSFEGPLDLLLFLIRKDKMKISDVCISELVDQYMEQVNVMQAQNMDVASEFLEMAARLVYLKTVSLLPKQEEAEQLRRELTGQLIEYDQCRKAAELLGNRFSFDVVTRAPEKIECDTVYRRTISPGDLAEAYGSAVGRGKRSLPPKPEEFSAIVSHRIVSVGSRIIAVLRGLRKHGASSYDDLYRGCTGRSELVATFLAVLELIRGKRIRLAGERGDTVYLMSRNGRVSAAWKD